MDANILFAALIKDSTTRGLLLSDQLSLLVPEFIIEEFENHVEELAPKTKLDAAGLSNLTSALIRVAGIEVIPKEVYKEFLKEAGEISPDTDDVQYFALALKYDCPVWSNEKRLKEQQLVRVFTTRELIEFLKF